MEIWQVIAIGLVLSLSVNHASFNGRKGWSLSIHKRSQTAL